MGIANFLALVFIFSINTSQANRLKNVVPISKGQVFPKPQFQIFYETQNSLSKNEFRFEYVKGSQICDVVSIAFNRYYKIIFGTRLLRSDKQNNYLSSVKKLTLMIHEPCEPYPSLESDESCNLFLN